MLNLCSADAKNFYANLGNLCSDEKGKVPVNQGLETAVAFIGPKNPASACPLVSKRRQEERKDATTVPGAKDKKPAHFCV